MATNEQLQAATSLALVELRSEIRELVKSVDRIGQRASLPERAFVLAGKLQSWQTIALAISFAIVTVALAMAVPLAIGGLLLAVRDPAAVLAFVIDLFQLAPGAA